MILIDKFITTGKTHFICQDYIISGEDYIVLSDGCSGAENSDVGARILCHTAVNFLETWKHRRYDIEYYAMGLKIIYQAQVISRALNLSDECLTATLIVAFVENNIVDVFIYGDGYIILSNNNEVFGIEISYTNNRPFYLSYYLNPDQKKLYESLHETQLIKIDGNIQKRKYDAPIYYRYTLGKGYLRTAAIASDGIGKFSDKPPIGDIVQECVAFKQTKGLFLQRRMTRMLFNHQRGGSYNDDDISIGAFHMEGLDESLYSRKENS